MGSVAHMPTMKITLGKEPISDLSLAAFSVSIRRNAGAGEFKLEAVDCESDAVEASKPLPIRP
jgi:hypothetical protein